MGKKGVQTIARNQWLSANGELQELCSFLLDVGASAGIEEEKLPCLLSSLLMQPGIDREREDERSVVSTDCGWLQMLQETSDAFYMLLLCNQEEFSFSNRTAIEAKATYFEWHRKDQGKLVCHMFLRALCRYVVGLLSVSC